MRVPGAARPALAAAACALALGAGLGACGGGGAGADRRPDLVLVVVDTLRADHLGCYGYGRPTSPRLDALAARGTLFEDAWAAAPWTLPSIMSIITSRYPSSHRVENDGLRLSASVPTLAETLHAAGYASAGFVSHIYVTAPFGFARGFDRFEDFGLTEHGYRLEAGLEPPADRVTDAALAWVRRAGTGPLFLFVHYFDAHWPYTPPERFRALFPSAYAGPLDAGYDSISKFQDPAVPIPEDYRSFLVDRYDGEIRFVDEQIGRLLDGLAAARGGRPSWIVVTGDHGEEFKDHGSMGHGRQLYEEVIRVPLIAAGPHAGGAADGGAPARTARPVSGIDLMPTLLDLAGAGAPAGLEGRSLAGLLRGGAPPPPEEDRPILSETVRLNSYRRAVRLGSLKLIHFMVENRAELYDLAADPRERHDLDRERPGDHQRLMQALFAQGDLLSGAWNLRWVGDGRPHRFEGRITTRGIFGSLVPMFHERGRFALERNDLLVFVDPAQSGESGLSFTTLPYEADVTFQLSIDGRVQPQAVLLGRAAVRPRALPITLEGAPDSDAAFVRPPAGSGTPPMFLLWRTRPAAPDQPVQLDDETRARLRSLGYVD